MGCSAGGAVGAGEIGVWRVKPRLASTEITVIIQFLAVERSLVMGSKLIEGAYFPLSGLVPVEPQGWCNYAAVNGFGSAHDAFTPIYVHRRPLGGAVSRSCLPQCSFNSIEQLISGEISNRVPVCRKRGNPMLRRGASVHSMSALGL